MQNQFVDLYRNSVKTTAEVTRSSLEGVVQFQERQLGILRGLMDEQRRSVESMAEAKTIEDLITTQSRAVGAQVERMAELWSNLVQSAADQQKAWIERMQSQVGMTKERMRETYELTARTSEEFARNAANNVSRATGSVREAASGSQDRQRKSA